MKPASNLLGTVAFAVAAVVAGVVGVLLYRQGIESHPFPNYVQGDPPYDVVRYSAPWIASGIVVAGVGVILLAAAVRRIVLRRTDNAVVSGADPSWLGEL